MLSTAKVVGLNLDTAASLILVSSGSLKTRLYALVSSSCEDAFTRTRQVLSEIEGYFYGYESDEEKKLENGSISQKLTLCLEHIKKSLGDADSLQVLLAATQDDDSGTVYYLLSDQGGAVEKVLDTLLIRGNQETSLCQLGESSELVSGVLKEGDRVVMYTSNLSSFLGSDFRNLITAPLENLEDEIPNLLAQNQAYQTAAIVIEKPKEQAEELAQDTTIREANPQKENVVPRIHISINFQALLSFLIRGLKRVIPRSRKSIFATSLLLLIIAIVLTVLTYKYQKQAETKKLFTGHLQVSQGEYQKALSLKDSDPTLSNQSLLKAQASLAEALKINPKDPAANDLKKTLEGNSADILKAYSVSTLPVWMDLDLIKKGLTARDLSLSHNQLLILDPNQKSLISISLNTKSPQILAGKDQLGDGELASLNGNTAWVYSSDKGLVLVDIQNQKPKQEVKPDEGWEDITDIYGFAGNIYLLDKGKSMVWKYLPVEGGYTEKREYLKVKADLSTARKMQIDSSVWILKDGGEILKYTQGSPDFFSIGGLDKGIKNPRSFYVSDETDNLYLLDSDNNRMVVFDKKGAYLSQYQSDQFSKFSDLVVDEEGKKAYLLDNSKIYILELR